MTTASRIERLRIFLVQRLFSTLAGVTARDWCSLLSRQRFRVHPPFWPRAALITLLSFGNSFHRFREERKYGSLLAGVKVKKPLFILGHWRSGTSYLHNLLAVDERFAYPNAYQVFYPHSFLLTEGSRVRRWGFLLPRTRLIDNMSHGFHVPFEDEFAIAAATFKSPYLSGVFPESWDDYDRYLTLKGVPEEEVTEWKEALVLFLRKLTWKYGRPLLLKSPPHTCRIRLLLELFPDARFVHIHRHPYAVFQSTRHMMQIASPTWELQRSDVRDLDTRIIRRYREMYEAFFEERGLIPRGRFHEIAYEGLESDPVGQLRLLYEALGLPAFNAFEPALLRYLASLEGYRKNEHAELSHLERRQVREAWARSFEEWSYDP